MKKILFIATGGTIASKEGPEGLTPGLSSEELLSYIPDIGRVCEVESMQLMSIDSTNMCPENWRQIADTVRERYDTCDGFVIAHGTDTMAYTAAALSYMIQNSAKPIVITGAQKPINLDVTDARTNLYDSFLYASDDGSRGVQIVFDGKIIAGTRAKKVRTKSYNAFSSIDYPYLGVIRNGMIIRYLPVSPCTGAPVFRTAMEDKVFLLKLIPGMKPDILKAVFEQYRGIVVESFGSGGIPAGLSETFTELCSTYTDRLVVMCTQVVHEGSDMTVYEVGQGIKSACSILESYDMTLEAVITKVMWVLANCEGNSPGRLFSKSISCDSLIYQIKDESSGTDR